MTKTKGKTPTPDPDEVALDSLIVKASDSAGHRVQSNCSMPPYLSDAMMAIVNSGESPWKDPGYFKRGAIKLLVSFWAKLNPKFRQSSVYLQLQSNSAIIEEEEKSEYFITVLGRLSATVNGFTSRGPEGEAQARRLLLRVLNDVRAMPLGYYRNQYLKELRAQYGKLLERYEIDWSEEMQAPVEIGDVEDD